MWEGFGSSQWVLTPARTISPVFGPLAVVRDLEAPPPRGPGSQWWGERRVPNRITAGSADVREYETRILNRHVQIDIVKKENKKFQGAKFEHIFGNW